MAENTQNQIFVITFCVFVRFFKLKKFSPFPLLSKFSFFVYSLLFLSFKVLLLLLLQSVKQKRDRHNFYLMTLGWKIPDVTIEGVLPYGALYIISHL